MEVWQKTYIRKNLPRFLSETKVNAVFTAFLLADDVLSEADVEKINAIGDRDGDMAKAKVLYDLLVTRTNGYKAIGKATFESKQSGAFRLLLKGLVEHLLQKSSIDIKEETLDEILQAECVTDYVWQFFIAKVDKGTLYEDIWIAPPRPLYIPRYISNRIKVEPEVFKQNCSDVFVFTGITRSELSKLAETSRTALSSQVIVKNMNTIRFVLLEHEHHWDKLRSVWKESPIHLIQFEADSSHYILQNSTRPSKLVSEHVPPHLRDKSLYVPEEEFLTQINNDGDQHTICICDTPGMGKTWLLENMARQIQQSQPSRMIAVIGLQRFVEQTQTSPQNSFKSDKPIQILLKYLCPFQLTAILLERALESNQIQLELFLDGFDEIQNEYVQTTQNFIKSVAENRRNVNLIITSRPHLRSELEKTFKGVAYDILPFSEENQADFLVRYWQKFAKRPQELNSERLRIFAQECLNYLKESLTKQVSEMMGIPLQCYLLATVNLTNAELYCHRDNTLDIPDFISPTSWYDMYTKYFEDGLDRAIGIHGHTNYENQSYRNQNQALKRLFSWVSGKINPTKSSSEVIWEDRQKLKAFHVWMALQLLIPEFAEDYHRKESIPEFESERILACGILQNSSSDKANPTALTFVHRTFAEFLVAEIINTSFKSMRNDLLTKYIRCFVTNMLSTQLHDEMPQDRWADTEEANIYAFKFRNSAIVYFLNANLQSNTEMSFSNLVSQELMQCLSAGHLGEILSACISASYSNIIRLFKNLLKPIASKISSDIQTFRGMVVSIRSSMESEEEFGFSPHKYNLIVRVYLCQAAAISNVRVLEELYGLFEECLHENLNEFCSRIPKHEVTPLHYAVGRVDYSIVEYFVNQFTLSGRRILFSFSDYGAYDSQNAIEICKLLFTKDTSIIFETNDDKTGVILNVRDVELIKFLVERGADVRDARICRDYEETVLTINAMSERMDTNEFGELCRYLLNEIKAYDLFTPNLPFWNDPLPHIIDKIDDDILMSILQIPGIRLDSTDRWGNNLILHSIKEKRKLSIVTRLVDLGVDAFAKNEKAENALHLAVSSGSLDTTKYLLSFGFDIEEEDNGQCTALHFAFRNIEMMKFLISKNSNILAATDEGKNIAHRVLADNLETDKRAVVFYLMSLREGTELFKMTDKYGRTPVHEWFKSWRSNPDSETVELILQKSGEDVNATDSFGWTMFLWAACNVNSVACLKCLKKFGANHNVTNKNGRNALHFSAEGGFLEPIKYLMSIGLSLEGRDQLGHTPLLQASYSGNVKNIRIMISQNANVLAVNNDGNNIAHIGLRSMQKEKKLLKTIVEYLLTLPQGPQLFKMTNKNGRTPMHYLIADKDSNPDSEIVELILQTFGEDVNATDSNGWTMFLHLAYKEDSVSCLKCLKKFGANHNVTTPRGRNAFHLSAEIRFLESTMYFVSIGMSLEVQDDDGNTPILIAAYRQNFEVMEHMISQNANLLAVNNDGNNIAHLLFSRSNHNKFLKAILEYSLTLPQAQQLLEMRNKEARTPLHELITHRDLSQDLKSVKLILQKSVEDVNATDSDGWTMFLLAAYHSDSVAYLKCLKKFGANHNVTTPRGMNALHLSAEGGFLQPIKYLMSIGLLLELQDNDGNSPILRAAHSQQVEVIKYLISKNANVLAVNNNGNNVAHMAVSSICIEKPPLQPILLYLLSLPQGPQLFKMTNKNGRTPLHQLVADKVDDEDAETVELILQTFGEDVNATDSDGWTMFLHAANKEDSVECLKCLKKIGANHNVTTPHGRNSLHISAARGFLEPMNYLVSIGLSLEHQDYQGNTPILLAPYWEEVEVMKHMISQNANVLAVNNNGDNIAHVLLPRNYDDDTLKPIVEYLLTLPEAKQLFEMRNKEGRTPLHELSRYRDLSPNLESVEMILQKFGEDVNATDSDGWTMFLYTAKRSDSVASLKCLKKFGANHNVTTPDRKNALYISAARGFLESMNYLVSIGVSLEHQDKGGLTPIFIAAYCKNFEMIKCTIHENANVFAVCNDGNNIVHAMFFSTYDDEYDDTLKLIVEFLLTLPQAPQLLKMRNKEGRTPLHEWIKYRDLCPDSENMELILQISGEDVNATDSDGWTMFLHAANKEDSVASLKCLKKFGANHNATIPNGNNALHISALGGFLESTKYLVSIGVSLEQQDSQGYTPTHIATYCQNLEIIKCMIYENANVLAMSNDGNNIAHMLLDSCIIKKAPLIPILEYLFTLPQGPQHFKKTNKNGRTPMHDLIADKDSNPDSEIVELILQTVGEDVNATDSDGWTMFLYTAKHSDSVASLKCLKKFGANHNATTPNGNNALHISAERGFLESTKYLVSIGLPLELQDNDGDTPILGAAYYQKVEVVKYLISQNANVLAVNNNGNNIAHEVFSGSNDDDTLKPIVQYLLTLPQAPQLFKTKNIYYETPFQTWIKPDDLTLDTELLERLLQISGENLCLPLPFIGR